MALSTLYFRRKHTKGSPSLDFEAQAAESKRRRALYPRGKNAEA